MICHEYRCLFVHIPKAAGQSVERFFLSLLGLTWEQRAPLLLAYNGDPARGPERLAHLTAEEYVRCGHIDAERFQTYFKFSFVRNPWARLVSEYHYREYDKRSSFRDFVLRGLPAPGLSDAYRHVLPQYDFLHAADGRLLVDFVGRFENLQSDFAEVCARLGLAHSRLPHVRPEKSGARWKSVVRRLLGRRRTSRHRDYTAYYDDETREVVAALYYRDIAEFGYAFGDGAATPPTRKNQPATGVSR